MDDQGSKHSRTLGSSSKPDGHWPLQDHSGDPTPVLLGMALSLWAWETSSQSFSESAHHRRVVGEEKFIPISCASRVLAENHSSSVDLLAENNLVWEMKPSHSFPHKYWSFPCWPQMLSEQCYQWLPQPEDSTHHSFPIQGNGTYEPDFHWLITALNSHRHIIGSIVL